jgi:hypothetical protein
LKRLFSIICILTTLILYQVNLYAWDGYDYDTSNYIEIEHSVVAGKDIEIYDYDDESYHDVLVISINRNRIDLEVFDYDTSNYRTFEMKPTKLSSTK